LLDTAIFPALVMNEKVRFLEEVYILLFQNCF